MSTTKASQAPKMRRISATALLQVFRVIIIGSLCGGHELILCLLLLMRTARCEKMELAKIASPNKPGYFRLLCRPLPVKDYVAPP